jgi:membrane-associated phospholipid phosphatase
MIRAGALIVPVLVGFSRVDPGEHLPCDVIAGWWWESHGSGYTYR